MPLGHGIQAKKLTGGYKPVLMSKYQFYAHCCVFFCIWLLHAQTSIYTVFNLHPLFWVAA